MILFATGGGKKVKFGPILGGLLTVGAAALPASAQAKIDFDASILSLIKTRCYKCHSADAKNPKAGLRLDGKHWILQGSDRGKVIVPGNSKKSELIRRLSLNSDHEDFMPKKGTPVRPRQIKLIAQWIDAGADFGHWIGAAAPGSSPQPKTPGAITRSEEHAPKFPALQATRQLGSGLAQPSSTAVAKATSSGALIRPAQPGSPLLNVAFWSKESKITDAQIALLEAIAPHVTDLNLAKTKATDASMATVSKMKRLTRLNLAKTAVTDSGLAPLKTLSALRYLNLHTTAVTDAGLKHLMGLRKLEALYLYQTQVTESGISKLAKALPNTKIVHRFVAPSMINQDDDRPRRKR